MWLCGSKMAKIMDFGDFGGSLQRGENQPVCANGLARERNQIFWVPMCQYSYFGGFSYLLGHLVARVMSMNIPTYMSFARFSFRLFLDRYYALNVQNGLPQAIPRYAPLSHRLIS